MGGKKRNISRYLVLLQSPSCANILHVVPVGLPSISSVLWRCWLGLLKGIQPVEWWVLVCWWRQFDCSFARLMTPVVTNQLHRPCCNKIQNGHFLVPANPSPPGKWPLKRIERVPVGSPHPAYLLLTSPVPFIIPNQHCQTTEGFEWLNINFTISNSKSTLWNHSVCSEPLCITIYNEKALRETQTLRAGCSKAEPKIFAPPQTPSRGAGRPKFNQLEKKKKKNLFSAQKPNTKMNKHVNKVRKATTVLCTVENSRTVCEIFDF